MADALDAMSHDRPYRNARPFHEALEAFCERAGRQCDPRIVDGALALARERWAAILGVPA